MSDKNRAERIYEVWNGLCAAIHKEIDSFNEVHRLDKHRGAHFNSYDHNAYLIWENMLTERPKLPTVTLTLDRPNCSIHAEYENLTVKLEPVDLYIWVPEDNTEGFLKRADGAQIEQMEAVSYLVRDFLAELGPPKV
jgi:hypothetical protein